MNLLQMPCVATWAWSFLTSEVVEAKNIISECTLWHFISTFGFPQRQFCLPKIQRIGSLMAFSLRLTSISQILQPSPCLLVIKFELYTTMNFWKRIQRNVCLGCYGIFGNFSWRLVTVINWLEEGHLTFVWINLLCHLQQSLKSRLSPWSPSIYL